MGPPKKRKKSHHRTLDSGPPLRARKNPALLAAKMCKTKVPSHRKLLFNCRLDYSDLPLFRELLDNWNSRGFISFPLFALEISSLFLRCLNACITRTERNILPEKSSLRPYVKGVIAALAWTYSTHYRSRGIVTKGQPVQSLAQLSLWNRDGYEKAMEMVELLVACSWYSFKIRVAEVTNIRVGSWFEDMLDKLQNGVHGLIVGGGLYLPFYIVLRAIHPDCPELDEIERFDLSLAEEVTIYWLEPRLFTGAWGKINKFPPSLEDGRNYNLWYYYDSLQPEPF